MPILARIAASGLVLLALSGCGSSADTSVGGATSPTADAAPAPSAWRSKCATCHVPIEPGTHTREALVGAFDRHKKRVRLSDAEWAEMTDFLARPSVSSRTKSDGTPPL